MARVKRNRSRPGITTSGNYLVGKVTNNALSWSTSGVRDTTRSGLSSTCSDWVGSPVSPGSLAISRGSAGDEHMVLNGDVVATIGNTFGGSSLYGLKNGNITRYQHYPFGPSDVSTSPLVAPNGLVAKIAASTNPSRAQVSPLTLIQDLVELPKMLREAGKFLQNPKRYSGPRDLASQFLAVKFGWFPLIQDLKVLLNVQSYVEKRKKELHQLYYGNGLRRKRNVGEDTSEVNGFQYMTVGVGGTYTLKWSVFTKKKSWATIRWRPTTPPKYHPADMRYNRQVRDLVLGLSVEGTISGVWDVIPWTWLLDWFYNFGDMLNSTSFSIPATYSNVCFMSQADIIADSPHVEDLHQVAVCTLEAKNHILRSLKNRSVLTGPPLAGANMPDWDMSKLSVLSALYVQRFHR